MIKVATLTATLSALTYLALANGPRQDSPRPERSVVETLEGDFELTSSFWLSPSAPPEITVLDARRRATLDGRVLQIDVGREGQSFAGTGLLGFDDEKQHYWYVWTDTSVGGRAVLEGSLDEHGVGTLRGHTPTPFGTQPLRVESRREGSTEIHDYYGPDDTGEDFRWMELRFQPR